MELRKAEAEVHRLKTLLAKIQGIMLYYKSAESKSEE